MGSYLKNINQSTANQDTIWINQVQSDSSIMEVSAVAKTDSVFEIQIKAIDNLDNFIKKVFTIKILDVIETGILNSDQYIGYNLYPNPNNGVFTISFKNRPSGQMNIYTVSGSLVYQKKLDNSMSLIDVSFRILLSFSSCIFLSLSFIVSF